MSKCDYCKERGKRENILEDKDIILKIKKDRVLGHSIRIDTEEHAYATNIKYCPMCGRKLERGK